MKTCRNLAVGMQGALLTSEIKQDNKDSLIVQGPRRADIER